MSGVVLELLDRVEFELDGVFSVLESVEGLICPLCREPALSTYTYPEYTEFVHVVQDSSGDYIDITHVLGREVDIYRIPDAYLHSTDDVIEPPSVVRRHW